MQNKQYGEFDSFDDFFNDLLSEFDDHGVSAPDSEPAARKEFERPASEKRHVPNEKRRHEAAEPVLPLRQEVSSEYSPAEDLEEYEEKHQEKRVPAGRRTVKRGTGSISGKTARRSEEQPGDYSGDTLALRKSIPFLSVLFVLTVFAWIIPIRPTVSETEKRNLETFPVFSVSELLSGDYFKSIESWFSDTFTFRDSWIDVADGFKKAYGIQSVAIYGDLPDADEIPVPAAAPIQTEKTEPAVTPEPEPMDMESEPIEPEIESIEEEPAAIDDYDETEWGGVELDEDILIADRDAKLQIGDAVYAYPGFKQFYAEKYAEAMNKAADILEGKANLYSIIVPYRATAMLSKEDRLKYNFVIEEDSFEYMYSLMNDNVKKVNVIKNLQKHNDEYLFFRSDPHWTAVGAYYAYEKWCEVAGKEPVPLSEYKEIVWEDFFGTYYYTSGKPVEIKNNPDSVHAFVPPGDVHLYLDFNNGDRLGSEADILLDRSVRKVDQYITFIGSDKAKATFINNSIDDDSAVLVLKTSYGNPFVYYLTQHYHTVYVVDMRNYVCRPISQFVDKFNVQDVIYIHSSASCCFDQGYAMITRLIR